MASIDLCDIKTVRCYHATRLPAKECIEQNGLLLPTVQMLSEVLKRIGVSTIDKTELQRIIEENGRNIFVHISKDFLVKCDYQHNGSEKIRKYIHRLNPTLRNELDRYNRDLTGYIIDLEIPVDYFGCRELKALKEEDNLHDTADEVDVSMEVVRAISP